ncbi:unnamed protein product [Adineta steineri]|uniref:Aminotransferase class I/classII large domain-containing protein n=1 Tax=Adineta steineri TaxID=433720 RepID=A0A815K4W7_9BILA|nr:unnamed protein product [Adineta steineri]CAF3599342.1 unnamed protein product [Adineta steineri]
MSLSHTPKMNSTREQFLQDMQKYFESSTIGKGIIDLLASTRPNCIDIYLDNNDYLHLSFDPRLIADDVYQYNMNNVILKTEKVSCQSLLDEKQQLLISRQGSDNIMSGLFLQEASCQYQVSDLLAKQILGKESVYLTQSGYVANYGLLQALVIPAKTHIYIDTAAHESLWQGASRGIIHKIKHNSLDDLEENLRKFGSGIIVVDSLYSGKGSIADLIELCNLKEQYNCMLIVDESHSIGLYGQHGRGLASLGNVTDRIDFITGSLAKAYCVRAGFIAGRTQEILYVREKSSAAIFSSALMNWDVQRLQRAINIIYNADEERQRLLHIATTVRHAAVTLEFDVEQTPLPSPILCLNGGPNLFSKKIQSYFENAGISGAIFIAPAMPLNGSMLRLTFHAGLSDEDVSRIINTLEFIAQHQRSDLPYTFLKRSTILLN